LVLVLSAGLYGCVVPPSLREDEPDAGNDAAPVIVSVRGADGKELKKTTPDEPISVVRNQPGDATITVYDADIGDTIIVQGFVDYLDDNATGVRSSCMKQASTSTERTLTCSMRGLCTAADTTAGNKHFLVFEVYDREVTNDPLLFRSVEPPGRLSSISYVITCLDPPAS
jgi:hypothetical protein